MDANSKAETPPAGDDPLRFDEQEEDRRIAQNAPNGATYFIVAQYDLTEGYFHLDKELALHASDGAGGWREIEEEFDLAYNYECRSIADVRLINALRDEVVSLRKQLSGLKKESSQTTPQPRH